MSEYFDPNDGWRPPPRHRERRPQSTFSIAMEALGGGLVFAVVLAMLKKLLGF